MFLYEPDEANPTWPDGVYPARIVSVKPKTSKAGNAMLEVCLEACRGAERKRLWDYVVRPTATWKLAQLADALGAITEFRSKAFDLNEHVGKSIDLAVVTSDNPDFGKQNRIAKYMKPKEKVSEEVDSDVPL